MSRSEAGLWVVADGMGGCEAGDVASNMIVNALEAVEKNDHLNDFVDAVEDEIIDANRRILEYSDIMLDGRVLGSTVISLIIRGKVGVCLWAGDSRLYRYRNTELLQLSRDHSQVEELLQHGEISPEEAENHPEANVITRAVGTCEDLYVDINAFSVQLGDTFLLCSDGLYNSVNEDDVVHYMAQNDIANSVKMLIVKALENGASDNISIIIVKGEPDKVDIVRH